MILNFADRWMGSRLGLTGAIELAEWGTEQTVRSFVPIVTEAFEAQRRSPNAVHDGMFTHDG